MMLFSIITPSYNQGGFLSATIESVIGQTGDFSIDYIIVDGGSSDNTVDVIRQYEELLQRGEWPIKCQTITFRWVSETDKGQTDALMKGFRMARGELFAWLNSDDTYLPGTLQIAADFFSENTDAGLMYGKAHYCDADGKIVGTYRTDTFDLGKLAYANIISQPAAFFRRNAFEAVGGLDVTLHYSMDYDLWIRLGKHFPCHHITQFLATYRLHETSKTINNETLIRNSEESLGVTLRHFDWAPMTRVYTACAIRCTSSLPDFLIRNRLLFTVLVAACSIASSLRLNHGLHRNDLKLLTRENFRKLFKERLEIMTGG